jgi:DNA polymerase III delta prime subunit
MFEHGDDESVEDLRRMLGRISRYERRHPSTPTATLGTALGVTARQRFVMWILLVDRMHCSDELLGYSTGQLANLLGYERPADVSKLCELLGRDGPFVREGYVRHLEESCRLIDSRLTITDTFAQAMLGDGVSLAPFVGGRSERAQSQLAPWMGRRSETRSHAPTSAPPPHRPLVLPEAGQVAFRRALAQVPLRKKVAEEMGYGALIGYGLGSVFLFEGAPGTGKTLAASVVAHELDRPLLKVPASQLLNAYVGGTESKIQEVFGEAKRSGAVLLIDEADSLLGAREQAVRSWEVSQVNTLLHCIEHFEGVVVLTTNFVGRLDKALERRLSLRLRFERPGPKERQQIWGALVGDRFHVEPKHLEEVARAESMTGSQIKTAVLELAMLAIERPNRAVTRDDLVLAVQRATQATSSMSTELVAGF